MTDDTRERFLREITAQVPADQIAEVHLFRPLRRGGTETGVAVIAAERADMVRVSDALHAADSVAAEGVVDTHTASSERSPRSSAFHCGDTTTTSSRRWVSWC